MDRYIEREREKREREREKREREKSGKHLSRLMEPIDYFYLGKSYFSARLPAWLHINLQQLKHLCENKC